MRRTNIGICCYNEVNEIFHNPFLQFFLSHCACKSHNLYKLLMGENIVRRNCLNVSHNEKYPDASPIYDTNTCGPG